MKLKHACLFLTVVLLAGCGTFDTVEEKRRDFARYSEDPIKIGTAWPFSAKEDLMWEGLKLARDEINRNGGVHDRPIELLKTDDEASVNLGRRKAQQLADNPEVLSVIGHYNSYVSIPASHIYQFNELLMVSPGSTNPDLTRPGYDLVFRTIPPDHQIGRQLADFSLNKGYERVTILYASNSYGRGLADAFDSRASELGVRVIDRLSYDPRSTEYFEQVVAKWKRYNFDAVFLAGTMPQVAEFIRLAGENNLDKPVLGGDGLDSPRLWEIAGSHANNTVAAATFHPTMKWDKARAFTDRFKEEYGDTPDAWAAQGYDTLKVLVNAMRKTSAPTPKKTARQLEEMDHWDGINGTYTFNEERDIHGKKMIFKTMRDGDWRYAHDEQIYSPELERTNPGRDNESVIRGDTASRTGADDSGGGPSPDTGTVGVDTGTSGVTLPGGDTVITPDDGADSPSSPDAQTGDVPDTPPVTDGVP